VPTTSASRTSSTQQLGTRWLTRERATAAFIEPSRVYREALNPGQVLGQGTGAVDSSLTIGSGPADRSLVPTPQAGLQVGALLARPSMEDARTFQLDNGAWVVIARHGAAPLVRATLIRRGADGPSPGLYLWSTLFDEVRSPELSEQSTRSVPGISPLDAAIQDMGASLQRRLADGTYQVSIEANSANLAGVVWLARSLALETRLRHRRRGVRLVRRLTRKIDAATPWFEAWQRVLDHLVGPGLGEWMALDVLASHPPARDDLRGLHELASAPDRTMLVVVGRVDPKPVENLVREYFADWPELPAGDLGGAPPAVAGEGGALTLVVPVQEALEVQALVNLTCHLHVTSDAMASITREAVYQALYRGARQAEGLVYAPEVDLLDIPGTDDVLLDVYAWTDPTVAGPLVACFERSIEQAPGTLSEFDSAFSAAAARRSLQTQSLEGLTTALAASEPGTLDGVTGYGSRLGLVTSDQVATALHDCLENRAVVVHGDRASLEASLEGSAFDYEVFPAGE